MKGQQKQKKQARSKQSTDEQATNDERFASVYSDPRFMTVPQKVKKIQIDQRFKKAITDKEFNLVQKVDKYGRKVNKQDNTMANFYKLEDNEAEAEKPKANNKYYDEEGKFKWDAQSSSDEADSEDAGQDDGEESHSESEDLAGSVDQMEEEQDFWSENEEEQPQPENVEVGKRLALTNMDWDNLTAVDILALFNSFCKGEMFIQKVEILPSLYGMEQMKKDSLYGPPKELFDEKATTKKKKKKVEEDDIDEDDENFTEGFDPVKLRQYELDKMKYFYAVIYCNSKKTALKIFEEYNNFEFEMTNLRLNLSFIADDLTFPQQPKETATEVPPDYRFKAANKLSNAKNHTRVKLTWDQTDPKRQQKMQEILNKKDGESDSDDYREFLASPSEDSEDDGVNAKDKIEEYRQKLLGALSSSKGDINEVFRKRDLQQDEGEGEELDVKFNVGFGEDIGKKILSDKKEKKEKERESEWQKYQRKRKEKKKEKKQAAKEKEKTKKTQGKLHLDSDEEPMNDKKKAELEMLIGEKRNGVKQEFKANTGDKRFEAVLKDKDYALDPTHKNFRKVAEGEFIKEQKLKRRKLHEE